jgi:hypothetical protein
MHRSTKKIGLNRRKPRVDRVSKLQGAGFINRASSTPLASQRVAVKRMVMRGLARSMRAAGIGRVEMTG